jgi:uncharacterized protein (TIGR00159 family)
VISSYIRIQDLADILIMTFLLYQLYCWFRKTRAMQVLLGLGVVTLIYFVTRFLGLYMTSWILQELGTVLIILIIVVFQAEIRQALYRFSLMRTIFDPRENERHSKFQEIAETLFKLADMRTGAILVFQRGESLSDLVLNGVPLDCEITPQILEAVFTGSNPLHDGAALIRGERIAQASCHLPLSSNPDIPQYYGTSHRAALGLSERSDALVVVVSEERGEVSLAEAGEFHKIGTAAELVAVLEERISPVGEKPRLTIRQRFFSNLLPKSALLIIVSAFWVLITSRQGQITTVTAPVRLHGVPEELVLMKNSPEEVEVQLKSFSILTPAPARLDIAATVDLSGIRDGQATVRIKNSDFSLPSGLVISAITPPSIKVVTDKKMRKLVPVRVSLRGRLPSSLGGLTAVPEPASVEIEGPVGQVNRIESVATEDVDAGRLVKGKEYRKNLQPLPDKVSVLGDEAVTIKLVSRRRNQ